VCGYIGEDGKVKQVCPACGAPLSSFEHYEYGINEKRLSNLSLHLHPILVHFPISIAILSFIFLVIAFLMKSGTNGEWILIVKIISIILPFTIIAAMTAGLFDAKSRLKDAVGRIQKRKIQLGTLFLVVSCLSAILINYEVFTPLGKVAILLLGFLGILLSALLGKKGASLLAVLIKD
jgi:uncharacterized membrane protein